MAAMMATTGVPGVTATTVVTCAPPSMAAFGPTMMPPAASVPAMATFARFRSADTAFLCLECGHGRHMCVKRQGWILIGGIQAGADQQHSHHEHNLHA